MIHGKSLGGRVLEGGAAAPILAPCLLCKLKTLGEARRRFHLSMVQLLHCIETTGLFDVLVHHALILGPIVKTPFCPFGITFGSKVAFGSLQVCLQRLERRKLTTFANQCAKLSLLISIAANFGLLHLEPLEMANAFVQS